MVHIWHNSKHFELCIRKIFAGSLGITIRNNNIVVPFKVCKLPERYRCYHPNQLLEVVLSYCSVVGFPSLPCITYFIAYDDDEDRRVCKTPGDPCGCTRQHSQSSGWPLPSPCPFSLLDYVVHLMGVTFSFLPLTDLQIFSATVTYFCTMISIC